MILFDNVTKTYSSATRPALDGVTLEVSRGEFVFVVGSSGSGKSTLLRLAIREERATSGQVLVAGRDLRDLPDRGVPLLRRQIGRLGWVLMGAVVLAGSLAAQRLSRWALGERAAYGVTTHSG